MSTHREMLDMADEIGALTVEKEGLLATLKALQFALLADRTREEGGGLTEASRARAFKIVRAAIADATGVQP